MKRRTEAIEDEQSKKLKITDEKAEPLFNEDDKENENDQSVNEESTAEDEMLDDDVDSDDDVKGRKKTRRRSTGNDSEVDENEERHAPTAVQALYAKRANLQLEETKLISYNFSPNRPQIRDIALKSNKIITATCYRHQQALLHRIIKEKYTRNNEDYVDVQFDYSTYGSGILLVLVSVFYKENRDVHLRLEKDRADSIPPDFKRYLWLLCMSRKEARKPRRQTKDKTVAELQENNVIEEPNLNENHKDPKKVKNQNENEVRVNRRRKRSIFSSDDENDEIKRKLEKQELKENGIIKKVQEEIEKIENTITEKKCDEIIPIGIQHTKEDLINKALKSSPLNESENVTRPTLVGNEQTRRLREEHGAVSVGVKYDDTLDLSTGQLLWFSQAQDNTSHVALRILEELRTDAADVVLAAKSKATGNQWEILGTPIEGRVHEYARLLIQRGNKVVVATKKKKGEKKSKTDVTMNQFKLHRPSPFSKTPKPYCAEVDGKKFIASDFSLSYDIYDGLDEGDIEERRQALVQQQYDTRESKLKASRMILSETRMITGTKECRFRPSDVCIYCGYSPASLWFKPHDDDVEHIKHVFFGEHVVIQSKNRCSLTSADLLPKNQSNLLDFFRPKNI